jgi:peptide/nickel transport system permease protein
MGISAGWRRGTNRDRLLTSSSMATWSTPDFWLGMILLTFFAVRLGLFPTGGIEDPASTASGLEKRLDQLWHMALPCLTLAIAYVGEFALVMRSSILDVMREDYLTLARAKGLRDSQVRDRHAVRNALLPSTALIAINFGFVLSGAIAVETVFSWPGLGLLTYESLRGPDLPMLQGLFLVFSAAVIVFNLLAELTYPFLDPRVRYR